MNDLSGVITAFALVAALYALPRPVVGDFDHDGKPDQAYVVPSPEGGFAIVVRRGADPKRPTVVFRSDVRFDLFMNKARPGRFRSACSKGYDFDDAGCQMRVVRSKGGELTFGSRDSSGFIVVWNGQRFVTVQLSD